MPNFRDFLLQLEKRIQDTTNPAMIDQLKNKKGIVEKFAKPLSEINPKFTTEVGAKMNCVNTAFKLVESLRQPVHPKKITSAATQGADFPIEYFSADENNANSRPQLLIKYSKLLTLMKLQPTTYEIDLASDYFDLTKNANPVVKEKNQTSISMHLTSVYNIVKAIKEKAATKLDQGSEDFIGFIYYFEDTLSKDNFLPNGHLANFYLTNDLTTLFFIDAQDGWVDESPRITSPLGKKFNASEIYFCILPPISPQLKIKQELQPTNNPLKRIKQEFSDDFDVDDNSIHPHKKSKNQHENTTESNIETNNNKITIEQFIETLETNLSQGNFQGLDLLLKNTILHTISNNQYSKIPQFITRIHNLFVKYTPHDSSFYQTFLKNNIDYYKSFYSNFDRPIIIECLHVLSSDYLLMPKFKKLYKKYLSMMKTKDEATLNPKNYLGTTLLKNIILSRQHFLTQRHAVLLKNLFKSGLPYTSLQEICNAETSKTILEILVEKYSSNEDSFFSTMLDNYKAMPAFKELLFTAALKHRNIPALNAFYIKKEKIIEAAAFTPEYLFKCIEFEKINIDFFSFMLNRIPGGEVKIFATRNNQGENLLHYAVKLANYKIVAELIKKFNIYEKTLQGDSLLHLLLVSIKAMGWKEDNQFKILKLLSEYKFNPYIKNNAGQTALKIAEDSDFSGKFKTEFRKLADLYYKSMADRELQLEDSMKKNLETESNTNPIINENNHLPEIIHLISTYVSSKPRGDASEICSKVLKLTDHEFVRVCNTCVNPNKDIPNSKLLILALFLTDKAFQDLLDKIYQLPPALFAQFDFNFWPGNQGVSILWIAGYSAMKGNAKLLDKIIQLPQEKFETLNFNVFLDKPDDFAGGISVMWFACALASGGHPAFLDKILGLNDKIFRGLNIFTCPQSSQNPNYQLTILQLACNLANQSQINLLERLIKHSGAQFEQLILNCVADNKKEHLSQQVSKNNNLLKLLVFQFVIWWPALFLKFYEDLNQKKLFDNKILSWLFPLHAYVTEIAVLINLPLGDSFFVKVDELISSYSKENNREIYNFILFKFLKALQYKNPNLAPEIDEKIILRRIRIAHNFWPHNPDSTEVYLDVINYYRFTKIDSLINYLENLKQALRFSLKLYTYDKSNRAKHVLLIHDIINQFVLAPERNEKIEPQANDLKILQNKLYLLITKESISLNLDNEIESYMLLRRQTHLDEKMKAELTRLKAENIQLKQTNKLLGDKLHSLDKQASLENEQPSKSGFFNS